MIRRNTPLKRSTKRIPQRRAKPRRGPMRDKGYRDWIREYRHCAICCGYPCDPAHTVNNGMRSKGPDSSCAPLCREHHEEYDAGRKAFEAKYGVDMKAKAAEWYAAYLQWKEQQ